MTMMVVVKLIIWIERKEGKGESGIIRQRERERKGNDERGKGREWDNQTERERRE